MTAVSANRWGGRASLPCEDLPDPAARGPGL